MEHCEIRGFLDYVSLHPGYELGKSEVGDQESEVGFLFADLRFPVMTSDL